MILEVACFSADDAVVASRSGADRIELCVNYKEGGLFPGRNELNSTLHLINIPVAVMIRPRSGDFIYSVDEIEVMQMQITECLPLKPSGFVFGILNSERKINIAACKELLEEAANTPCVFHRAFDHCYDLERAAEELIELGFVRILSSGGENAASDGLATLNSLRSKYGDNIEIMPGGGIRSGNVKMFSDFESIHSACRINGVISAEEIKAIKHQA